MNGDGSTVPGVYLEFPMGVVYGGASGLYWDWDTFWDDKSDFPTGGYSQQGLSTPQIGVAVLVVLPWDWNW